MNRNIGTVSSIAALLLGSSAVFAQGVALDRTIEIPAGNSGYANSQSNAIKTGLGDCLVTGMYDDESQVDACAGIEEAPAVAEPEPAPEPAPAPEPVKKEPIVTTATLGGEALFDTNSDVLNACQRTSHGRSGIAACKIPGNHCPSVWLVTPMQPAKPVTTRAFPSVVQQRSKRS